jgi:hypothetical protein
VAADETLNVEFVIAVLTPAESGIDSFRDLLEGIVEYGLEEDAGLLIGRQREDVVNNC